VVLAIGLTSHLVEVVAIGAAGETPGGALIGAAGRDLGTGANRPPGFLPLFTCPGLAWPTVPLVRQPAVLKSGNYRFGVLVGLTNTAKTREITPFLAKGCNRLFSC